MLSVGSLVEGAHLVVRSCHAMNTPNDLGLGPMRLGSGFFLFFLSLRIGMCVCACVCVLCVYAVCWVLVVYLCEQRVLGQPLGVRITCSHVPLISSPSSHGSHTGRERLHCTRTPRYPC